jgi:hypothetical protein
MIALKETIEQPEDSSFEYTILIAMFSFSNCFHDLLKENFNSKIDTFELIIIRKFKKLINNFISFRK